jgi:Condensation domain
MISYVFFCYLLITLASASYAQIRVWFDQQIRSDSQTLLPAIYNMPFLYRPSPHHTLSIHKLRHALYLLLDKHLSLRTALIFDKQNNQLIQRIIPLDDDDDNSQLLSVVQTTFHSDEQLIHIIHNETSDSQLFDLAEGIAFRCHLLHYQAIPTNDLLTHHDLIIFNFHHALFDTPSMDIFLADLNEAYRTGQLSSDHKGSLRYLDCKYDANE